MSFWKNGDRLEKAMNKTTHSKTFAPKMKTASVPILEFLLKHDIRQNILVQDFIERHNITTVAELLATSVIHEKSRVWRALAPLREELELRGYAFHRHRFLMSAI